MKYVAFLIFAFIVLAIYSKRPKVVHLSSAPVETVVQRDVNGFLPLPKPDAAVSGKVLIIAPPNCPSDAGVRADTLEHALSAAGVDYVRTGSVGFSTASEKDVDRLNSVMSGELPIVFVGGLAKNNPDVSEIIVEYRRTGGR